MRRTMPSLIEQWVRSQTRHIRPLLGAAFRAAREVEIEPWKLGAEVWKIGRSALLRKLALISGLERWEDVHKVIAEYQRLGVDRHRLGCGGSDRLDLPFEDRLRTLITIDCDPDDPESTYRAFLQHRIVQRRRGLERRASAARPCAHPARPTLPWRPCPECAKQVRWQPGDHFASFDERLVVTYGEVVDAVTHERLIVRLYTRGRESVVSEHPVSKLSSKLTATQMDRAARMGWPADIAALRAVVEQQGLIGSA